MTDLTVNVKKTINASIETVFDAWLNPETLSQFMLPMPGMPNPETESDAREGGSFAIHMQVGNEVIPHTGKYLEIKRPDKLVFSWLSPCSTDDSTVTLLFTANDDGTTSVELTHVKFIDEETRSDHEGGWSNILVQLNETLS